MARSSALDDVTDDSNQRWSKALANGAIGGFLGTVTMTVYRLPIARSLPPTEEFWTRYGLGDEQTESPVVALVLHLAYGTGAGAVFGPLFARMASGEESDAAREATSTVLSALYGIALSVFGHHVLLGRMLSMDLDADEVLVFYLSHIIYGLTLGTWVGSRTEERPHRQHG